MGQFIANFQSPFSGAFLCFAYFNALDKAVTTYLSIPIFRGFSLFPICMYFLMSFISSFIFQSPFSGAFLCFAAERCFPSPSFCSLSIPIFRGFSLFRKMTLSSKTALYLCFQSPFSGAFLCFYDYCSYRNARIALTFNPHFQGLFFVSLS